MSQATQPAAAPAAPTTPSTERRYCGELTCEVCDMLTERRARGETWAWEFELQRHTKPWERASRKLLREVYELIERQHRNPNCCFTANHFGFTENHITLMAQIRAGTALEPVRVAREEHDIPR